MNNNKPYLDENEKELFDLIPKGYKDTKWKMVYLKFKNVTIACATDGETIRLREPGMMSAEANLISCDDKEPPETLHMITDVLFNEPKRR